MRNPRSAADFFRNAWIHNLVRRDADGALASIQDLYRSHAPNKLDAAELYFNVGRSFLTREQLLASTIQIGRDRRDASMLVMAARIVDTNAEAYSLMDEARAIDPDLPFAYWDPFRVQFIGLVPGGTPQQNLEQPLASYYYLPQHAPDMESFVRSQLDTHRGAVRNWEQVVNGRGRLR